MEDSVTLELHDGAFQVRVTSESDGTISQGLVSPVRFGNHTGMFYFDESDVVEAVVRVMDGRAVNGHWWVTVGIISDRPIDVHVTDARTGTVWTSYGQMGATDTEAFPVAT